MLKIVLGVVSVVAAVASIALLGWCIARSSRRADERAEIIRRIQGWPKDEDRAA